MTYGHRAPDCSPRTRGRATATAQRKLCATSERSRVGEVRGEQHAKKGLLLCRRPDDIEVSRRRRRAAARPRACPKLGRHRRGVDAPVGRPLPAPPRRRAGPPPPSRLAGPVPASRLRPSPPLGSGEAVQHREGGGVGGQQRAEPREEDQVAAAARRVDDPDLCAGGEERLCRGGGTPPGRLRSRASPREPRPAASPAPESTGRARTHRPVEIRGERIRRRKPAARQGKS